MINKNIKEGKKDFFKIFRRIKDNDFSGDVGSIIKNSIYQTSSNIVMKFGSLIFTIILARLLMPELFGLYNLALSTIMVFYLFSDLGINQTLIYYISKSLGKKSYSKAKAYSRHLFLLKNILIFLSAVVLLFLSGFISNNYYQKPVFLALVAGVLFIIFAGFQSFLSALFNANNDFKTPFIKEIFVQILRVTLIPFAIIFLLRETIEGSLLLFWVIFTLAIVYLFGFLFLLIKARKIVFFKGKPADMSKDEKRNVLRTMIGFSIVSFPLIFFGNVDKIMLGFFVSPEFIGYYSAAFNIILALTPLIVFSEALFPVFLRMKKERAESTFRKSSRIIFMLSFLIFLVIFLFSNQITFLIFGGNYSVAGQILRVYSLMLLVFPITEVFSSYLISRGSIKKVSKLIILTILINILLNYIFPLALIKYGFFAATLGVVFSMILTRFFYLAGLFLIWRKSLNINKRG